MNNYKQIFGGIGIGVIMTFLPIFIFTMWYARIGDSNNNLVEIDLDLSAMNKTLEAMVPKNSVPIAEKQKVLDELQKICFTLGYGTEAPGVDAIDTPTLMAATVGPVRDTMKGSLKDRIHRTLDDCVQDFPNMFQ